VEEGRRVVPRVPPREERIRDDRAPEVGLAGTPAHALVHRLLQARADHVDVLAEVHEHHRGPRVLAVGVDPLGGELLVAEQEVQHLTPERRPLPLARAPDRRHHLGRDAVVDLGHQRPHRLGDLGRVDLAHGGHLADIVGTGAFTGPGRMAHCSAAMAPAILSTARPTRLRLAGFLTITLGGLLVGVGATLTWATVEPFDTPTKGVDLWEGRVALLAGLDAATASSRFTDAGQRDRIARALADELGEPYARVRARLEAVSRQFRVRLGSGILLVLAGGALAAVGGGLSIVWAGRWRPASRPAGETRPAANAPGGPGEAEV